MFSFDCKNHSLFFFFFHLIYHFAFVNIHRKLILNQRYLLFGQSGVILPSSHYAYLYPGRQKCSLFTFCMWPGSSSRHQYLEGVYDVVEGSFCHSFVPAQCSYRTRPRRHLRLPFLLHWWSTALRYRYMLQDGPGIVSIHWRTGLSVLTP